MSSLNHERDYIKGLIKDVLNELREEGGGVAVRHEATHGDTPSIEKELIGLNSRVGKLEGMMLVLIAIGIALLGGGGFVIKLLFDLVRMMPPF